MLARTTTPDKPSPSVMIYDPRKASKKPVSMKA